MTDQQRFHDKQWSLIVARAWADEDFRDRLVANPRAVLRENGLEIAPDVEVSVVEDSQSVRHYVLPANPAGDLFEEELSSTAVAYCFCGGCGRCGRCGCGCGICGGCNAM